MYTVHPLILSLHMPLFATFHLAIYGCVIPYKIVHLDAQSGTEIRQKEKLKI